MFGYVWNHWRRLELTISQVNSHPIVHIPKETMPSEMFVGLFTP